MTDRFTVLASGSAGNVSFLEINGFGLLIDCGLQPRALTNRLRAIGSSWDSVHGVILTHTHGDHWKDLTLADLRSRRIPIYAHATHLTQLADVSRAFEPLMKAGLTRTFSETHSQTLAPNLSVRPIPVSHDAEPTFAFRFDRANNDGRGWSVGYAADLGCGSRELIEAFADVDVLALEYNHDIQLEERSHRPRFLVDRVLSDRGHLSNCQAAKLTHAIAERSGEGLPGHLVQLHLSRECNRPELALAAGRASLARLRPHTVVVTARQDAAVQPIPLKPKTNPVTRTASRDPSPGFRVGITEKQPSLPGFEN